MSGFAAPPVERDRVGIVGLGNRGPAHPETMRHIEGVEFTALCDLLPERAAKAGKRLEGAHQMNMPRKGFFGEIVHATAPITPEDEQQLLQDWDRSVRS
jgi:predicted homoserine dehydrogenase-like protein